eukprot:364938-Chlamydomonas_euryale.AAC.40
MHDCHWPLTEPQCLACALVCERSMVWKLVVTALQSTWSAVFVLVQHIRSGSGGVGSGGVGSGSVGSGDSSVRPGAVPSAPPHAVPSPPPHMLPPATPSVPLPPLTPSLVDSCILCVHVKIASGAAVATAAAPAGVVVPPRPDALTLLSMEQFLTMRSAGLLAAHADAELRAATADDMLMVFSAQVRRPRGTDHMCARIHACGGVGGGGGGAQQGQSVLKRRASVTRQLFVILSNKFVFWTVGEHAKGDASVLPVLCFHSAAPAVVGRKGWWSCLSACLFFPRCLGLPFKVGDQPA